MTSQLDRIEWKIDQILAALATGTPLNSRSETNTKPTSYSAHIDEPDILPTLTVKQHAVLQMLLVGKSNQEIAERFDVTDNTAKVYVRSIAKKLGVQTRAQIALRTLKAFNAIDDNSYRMVAGGLPKDWDENYGSPDPFEKLYRRRDESET